MIIRRKSWVYILFLIGVIFLIGFAFVLFKYGSIDLKRTISTKYYIIKDTNEQIIETEFFKIRTPQNWFHIFGGNGNEGDPFGNFQTKMGVIFYEYGPFAPSYDEDDDIYNYKIEKRKVNRFKINIARNNKGETGICIPRQNEMKTSLTFYMIESVTKNFDELMSGIEEIEF
jgi:hypothetical protein